MNLLNIQLRIKAIQEELENRYKNNIIKMADDTGTPISTENLQSELYKLIYQKSKILGE